MTEQEPKRRLTKSSSDKMIAGVCGGLGEHFNTDPVLFRIGFVVLALMGGGGLITYLILMLVLPSDDSA